MPRFSNKKKTSLVLGGGGTKGFIHIGVLRYLEENNYTIQEITGTSAGALIGALIAIGRDSHQIETLCKELDNKDIIDIDRKNMAIGGEKILSRLTTIFKETNIEDLPIPFTAIVTDLNSGKEVVFNSGPVIDAVRYSISVPGVFSLHDEDKPYVDGGIINNLPINHLSYTRQIIASSCRGYGGFDLKKKKEIRGVNIGENPLSFKKRVISRSLLIMMRRIEDLIITQYPHTKLIRPYTGDMSPYNVEVLPLAIQRGYNQAKKTLG